jgi:hypothetical protein
LREFGDKVVHHYLAFGVGVVGGVLGIVNAVAAAVARPGTTPFSVPLWLWLSLLAAGFLLAIFRAFHEVRMERDAAKGEMERRFETQRYALTFEDLTIRLEPNQDHTWDMTVLVKFTNRSAEPLWYKVEETTTVIDGRRSVEQPTTPAEGAVIAPQGETSVVCDPVRGISIPWRDGSVEFAGLYGHPQGQRRYRKPYVYTLAPPRQVIRPGAPQDIRVPAVPIKNPEVEDIGDDQARRH